MVLSPTPDGFPRRCRTEQGLEKEGGNGFGVNRWEKEKKKKRLKTTKNPKSNG